MADQGIFLAERSPADTGPAVPSSPRLTGDKDGNSPTMAEKRKPGRPKGAKDTSKRKTKNQPSQKELLKDIERLKRLAEKAIKKVALDEDAGDSELVDVQSHWDELIREAERAAGVPETGIGYDPEDVMGGVVEDGNLPDPADKGGEPGGPGSPAQKEHDQSGPPGVADPAAAAGRAGAAAAGAAAGGGSGGSLFGGGNAMDHNQISTVTGIDVGTVGKVIAAAAAADPRAATLGQNRQGGLGPAVGGSAPDAGAPGTGLELPRGGGGPVLSTFVPHESPVSAAGKRKSGSAAAGAVDPSTGKPFEHPTKSSGPEKRPKVKKPAAKKQRSVRG